MKNKKYIIKIEELPTVDLHTIEIMASQEECEMIIEDMKEYIERLKYINDKYFKKDWFKYCIEDVDDKLEVLQNWYELFDLI